MDMADVSERPSKLGVEDCDWQITAYGIDISPEVLDELKTATSELNMITVTPEGVEASPLNVVAHYRGRLAGYTAITSEYSLTDSSGQKHPAIELGAMYTAPEMRGRGLASLIVSRTIRIAQLTGGYAPDTRIVAFTNNNSRHILERAGMEPLAAGEQVSGEAFDLCAGCNTLPLSGPRPWQDPSACCEIDQIRAMVLHEGLDQV
jgi:GNAT superfamily N-acetyltransferase